MYYCLQWELNMNDSYTFIDTISCPLLSTYYVSDPVPFIDCPQSSEEPCKAGVLLSPFDR